MSENRSVLEELQRRRDEVAASLVALERKRAETVQSHSFARSRERAGVTEDAPAETARLKADEASAHAAMRDARAELQRLDTAIESQPRVGRAARIGAALGRFRRTDR